MCRDMMQHANASMQTTIMVTVRRNVIVIEDFIHLIVDTVIAHTSPQVNVRVNELNKK